MKGSFLFLGTGSAVGVPVIGCECPVCLSKDSHNQRMRSSGLVSIGTKKLLIDTGPDFRMQALQFGLKSLEGVLLTHTHFDHVAGLDELRTYYLLNQQILPVLVSLPTLDDLKKRYDYLFQEKSEGVSLAAQLHFQVLEGERGTTRFLEIPISYMTYTQGEMPVNGFRFGDFAYITDIRDFPETIFEDLQDVKTLVLSAPLSVSTSMHFSIEEAIAFSKRVGAQTTYFTHLSHRLDHAKTNALLEKGFALAYDGQKVEFSINVE